MSQFADIADRVLNRVMLVVEAPLNGLERLFGRKRMPYFFLAPNLVLFGIFTFLPIAISIGYAFTGGTNLFVSERPYVGLDNFRQLLTCGDYMQPGTCTESLFWTAIWNTLWFVGFNVVATLLVSLITALILNRAMVARGFFRAMFFYPVLLSPVVIGLIWKWFLDRNGLLNAFLQMVGVPPEIFLLEVGWSRFFVVVVSVWFHMGFYTLILLAGLQAIPKDLYEAAAIDAATPRRVLFRITLPLLAPNLLVVLILLMIRSVQIFDEAWVLTNGGGPGTANSFIVQYIYQMAFGSDLRLFGLASAAATLMGCVLLVLTLLQLGLSKKMEQ
ncbi:MULTISPECIES: carbohydrate ABC transporter permease [Rhizobium/Agrobacterium group]|uniref:carbohydrate ABC transporter permease n=1 Tax=Rhizobium/Agrobacterium group TaxID=227290 RepID=UPI000B3FC508|nr:MULTISPECIES: sugar ABC transporter permease [Rhizobium/Agrobacterium group]MCF1481333.1 sugar ABC transporter permease [Allorhizobium ampelinum]NSZ18999.1 sugar ABC transporter permease [Agrobacterium vitis]NSZ45185.1 sugar ABC transporter permease [Agrobacterium vitis]NTA28932.1 sugar ABC transporter permease [Allorhizobium ampelinum]OVE90881.1 sugar ABC transporter permease [Allorhizobium ampelinum]